MVVMAILAIVLCVALLFGGSFTAKAQQRPTPEQATIVKDGEKAPNFEVQMFDGSTVKLSDLKGKVVLLNFWATWCPPCRAELARVEKDIIEKFKGKPFVFLPVSRGEEKATVAAFREKMGYTFPIGLDPDQSIYRKYASNYIPRSILVGRDGVVAYVGVGYDEQIAKELDEAITAALAKK